MPSNLTFADLRAANMKRVRRWHPGGITDWSLSDWALAVTGEWGEACNIGKKLNRHRDGIVGNKEDGASLRQKLAGEIADTMIYLDLFAASAGIDLGAETIAKFNAKSEEVGFPERLDPGAAGAGIPAEIVAERQRQMMSEGFGDLRDDAHDGGELATAAACYAELAGAGALLPGDAYRSARVPMDWPWADEWWKPKNPRRDLIRAAALIVAEIERLDRATLAALVEACPKPVAESTVDRGMEKRT